MTLLAGTYRTNMTPPFGIGLAGAFGHVEPRDILDNTYANAVVIDDGSKEVAIVSVDVCNVPRALFDEIASEIENRCGILKENVIVAATHTHAAANIGFELLDLYKQSPEYIYIAKMQIVTAVCMAQKRKVPVRIGVGKDVNENYTFNRRLKKPDGSLVMAWGPKAYLQDCISEGEVDPEVSVIKLENEGNQPIAFIVNVACHNNAAPGMTISADFSGYMGDILRKVYGPDVVVLFLMGTCGDVTWINYRDLDQSGPSLYKKIGTSFAGTVLKIESVMEYPEVSSIEISSKTITIPDRPYSEYDTKVDLTFGQPPRGEGFYEVYRRAKDLHGDKPLADNELDIHLLKLGNDIAIVTNPCEPFAAIGLEIKAQSPYKYTLISTLTNGVAGYAPTKEAFQEGGYEVRKVPGGSWLSVDAGEKIVKASIELLKR